MVTYQKIANLKGPEGKQGIQGAQGVKGDKGAQGDPGPAGAGGLTTDAAVAANMESGATQTNAKTKALVKSVATVKGAAGLYSADYVQVGDTDSTSELQALINEASAGRGRGGIAPGVYTAGGLVIPEYAAVDGWGAGQTRFPLDSTNQYRYGAVTIKRLAGSTDPIITLEGGGSRVSGIALDGNGGTGPVFRQRGFESEISNLRVINNQGIGFEVQGANNTRWYDIRVDDCGSASEPAVKVWSPVLNGKSTTVNTLDCRGLTIERQHGDVAFELAYGDTDVQHWAEWVRLDHVHIEASHLDHPNTVQPLMAIGNIRQFTLANAFIYGGPAVLLRHNQRAFRSYGNGGITLLGGSFNGSDVASGNVAATPTLIELVAGDYFAAIGTSFMRYSARAVAALSTYGAHVSVDPSCAMYGPGTTDFTDQRSTRTVIPLRGDVRATGHISTARTTGPTVTPATGITGQALLPATSDGAGKLSFGTTSAPPSAGLLATITFDKPYTREPAASIGAGTAATVDLGIYIAASTTQLKIYAKNAPAASQAAGAYQISYTVIGLDVS